MLITKSEFSGVGESQDQKDQVKRLFFRILPYTPLIFLTILIGLGASYAYLRYATPKFAAKARLIVNDDTQQKNTNLLDIMQLDTRNLSTETEREMQILGSKDLLRTLASKLQLNVMYIQKGYIKSGENFLNIPFKLILQYPDSFATSMSGEVEVVKNTIRFNSKTYPVDTFLKTEWGNIKWEINAGYKSPEVLHKWFVNVQPVGGIIATLQKSLTVQPISKQSTILELSFIDQVPERGVNILTNLISLYGSSTVDYKSRMSANTLGFLDDRLRFVSEELNGVEKNLQTFKNTQGIVDLGAEGTLFLGQLKETDSKIAEVDVQMDVLKRVEQYVNKRNISNSPVPASLGIADPVLNGLLNKLYESEFELEKIKQTSGSKNPQIEVYEESISKLKPSIVASINNLKLSMQAGRQRLQLDNSRLTNTLSKIPQKERLLLDISRQQGIKNAIYTFLLQKREESAIAAAAILPNYRVIEKPEVVGKVSPISLIVYIVGLFLALALITAFIYFKEFLNNRLLFKYQIENKVNIPILAELSLQSNNNTNPVVVGPGIRSLIGEQFRELRTNLNYITAVTKEKSKVILITSSIPGEGKSFVAINTSVTLSLTGAKVVLLEFDLRKPKISRELGIARDPGLSNYLINRANEKDIIKPHPSIANFSIIPSGPIPPNPSELISSERLTELMDYLKQNFDYIIIDSPPIGAVTDAKILAKFTHSTLYIVRHNYTTSSLLNLIKEVHQKNTLPNLNLIFNGITTKKILGYSYGKEYGYGYGENYSEGDKKAKKV